MAFKLFQNQRRSLIVAFATLLFACFVSAVVVEHFSNTPVLNYATKCVSCERALPPHLAWMGQPTKCFDCERELVARTGEAMAAFHAHPLKYY